MAVSMVNYEKKKEYWDPIVDDEKEFSIFSSYKDLFLFALVVGYNDGKRKELKNRGKKGEIRWEFFNGEDRMVINSISLNEENDVKLLIDKEEYLKKKIKIAEEYANHGIKIVKNELLEKAGSPLDNLINYINKHSKIEKKRGYIEELKDEL